MCPRGPYPKPTAANNRLGARRSMSRGIARSPRHRARAKATRLRISWITRRTRAPAPVGRRRPPSVVRSTGGGATARDFCIAIAKAAARSATDGAAALVPNGQSRSPIAGPMRLPQRTRYQPSGRRRRGGCSSACSRLGTWLTMELIVARRRRWSAALPGQTGSGGRVGRRDSWRAGSRDTLGCVQAFRLPAIAEPPPSRWSCAEMAKIAEGRAGRIDPLEEGPAQRIVASGGSVLHVGRALVSGRTSRGARSRAARATRRESAAGQSGGPRRAHR